MVENVVSNPTSAIEHEYFWISSTLNIYGNLYVYQYTSPKPKILKIHEIKSYKATIKKISLIQAVVATLSVCMLE